MKNKIIISIVILLIFTGCARKVKIPELIGDDYHSAENTLKEQGVKPNIHFGYSEDYEKNIVMSQSIEANQKMNTKEDVLELEVSAGIKPYIVPDLSGQKLDLVLIYMEDIKSKRVNFTYNIEYVESKLEKDTVISIEPNGSREDYTPVTITVSNGERT